MKSKKTLNPGEKYKKTWDPGMNTKQKPGIQKWKQNKNLEFRGENKKPILQGWKPKNLWFRVESQKTFDSGLKAKKPLIQGWKPKKTKIHNPDVLFGFCFFISYKVLLKI